MCDRSVCNDNMCDRIVFNVDDMCDDEEISTIDAIEGLINATREMKVHNFLANELQAIIADYDPDGYDELISGLDNPEIKITKLRSSFKDLVDNDLCPPFVDCLGGIDVLQLLDNHICNRDYPVYCVKLIWLVDDPMVITDICDCVLNWFDTFIGDQGFELDAVRDAHEALLTSLDEEGILVDEEDLAPVGVDTTSFEYRQSMVSLIELSTEHRQELNELLLEENPEEEKAKKGKWRYSTSDLMRTANKMAASSIGE